MTNKEKRIYAQYEKEVKEALDRWSEEPRERGHWIALGDKSPWPAFHDDAVQCSVCKFKYMRLMPRNYCPKCGAKMDEVEE